MGDRVFDPERLAYWYLRLNGFLTTENFVVHPERGSNQRTDADLLGVRFAGRSEGGRYPLADDPRVAEVEAPLNVVIAEVKTGRCSLNGPWTDPSAGNMAEVLNAIGCMPSSTVDQASLILHRGGAWSDERISVRLLAIGEYRNPDLILPLEQQLTWPEVIQFVVNRFTAYQRRKSAVGQWSVDGRLLRDASLQRDEARIRASFQLNPRRDVGV